MDPPPVPGAKAERRQSLARRFIAMIAPLTIDAHWRELR
jgi:hypothetical protein